MERLAGSDGASRQEAAHPRLILALRVALVLVGASPFLAPLLRPHLSSEAGELLYALFSPVCHRKAERTLALASVLMPICSRCAGIFVGFLSAGVWPRPRLSLRLGLWYGFFASVLMVIDVLLQDAHIHPFWHSTRLLTGLAWGHIAGLSTLALLSRWSRTSSPSKMPQ